MRDALVTALQGCGPNLLSPLRNARIVVTGGTGFVGGWVLRALSELNRAGWALRAQCVSRDPAQFLACNPDLAGDPSFEWLTADAAAFFNLPIDPHTTHILHMAASSNAAANYADPAKVTSTIVQGTHGCLTMATRTGARLHFVSSGAVYGERRLSDGPAVEDQSACAVTSLGGPRQAYASSKRQAEAMIVASAVNHVVSRPFAFLGPLLPLDQHFAAGNFIADACAGRPIVIEGNGEPVRSYMHPADLAAWLLALTGAPAHPAVNVGSDEAVSIAGLAEAICGRAASPPPRILGTPSAAGSDSPAYWPDISRAKAFGLRVTLPLERCIDDALAWARSLGAPARLAA